MQSQDIWYLLALSCLYCGSDILYSKLYVAHRHQYQYYHQNYLPCRLKLLLLFLLHLHLALAPIGMQKWSICRPWLLKASGFSVRPATPWPPFPPPCSCNLCHDRQQVCMYICRAGEPSTCPDRYVQHSLISEYRTPLTDFYRIFEKVSRIGEFYTYFRVIEGTIIYLDVTKERNICIHIVLLA